MSQPALSLSRTQHFVIYSLSLAQRPVLWDVRRDDVSGGERADPAREGELRNHRGELDRWGRGEANIAAVIAPS